MLKAKLVVVGGNSQHDEIDLHLPTVIGRGNEVNLALGDDLISRRHAEIYERNGRLMVKDLGSRNGTFVNNRKIQGDAVIESEELLTVGTITFRAIYQVQESLASETVHFNETVKFGIDHQETLRFPSDAEEHSRVSHTSGAPHFSPPGSPPAAPSRPDFETQETVEIDFLEQVDTAIDPAENSGWSEEMAPEPVQANQMEQEGNGLYSPANPTLDPDRHLMVNGSAVTAQSMSLRRPR